MNPSRERWALGVINGGDRSAPAAGLRALLALAEPFYAGAMLTRNALYDRGIFRSHSLHRPTISIGNLTTGGTGKTPVVRWLAERLIAQGIRPAILLRGYRSTATGGSDEQLMLEGYLAGRASVVANPDRVAGAADALAQTPVPDVFLLDDAFQHRRVVRDFDLALIDATNPTGFGHVIPRGLMREPVGGLKRADAILITRCNLVHDGWLAAIESLIRRHNAAAPIFHAEHVHSMLRRSTGDRPIDDLRKVRFFAFAGIANPDGLEGQFNAYGPTFAGHLWFSDHHAYTEQDLSKLRRAADEADAEMLVTTEKDWAKISALTSAMEGLPIFRAELSLRFRGDDEDRLLGQILSEIHKPTDSPTSTSATSPAP